MTQALTPPQDTDTTPRAAWLGHLTAQCEESGYLESVGPAHWALFADEGPVLLVSFDQMATFEAQPLGELPQPHRMAARNGWSHLSLIADGETWYRDARVWHYFDRLIDEGFFEDFDRVVFFGAGMGGYAAAAFSVAAPGSSVLAIRPLATLDPAVAGWDRRHLPARGHDFRSRFGYAPDMIAGQDRVFVLHDPLVTEDAMHAALFRNKVVRRLECRHLGPLPEVALTETGLIEPLLEAAMAGELSPALWARMWRGRRDHLPWLRNLAQRAAQSGSPRREMVVLQAITARFPGWPRPRRRLEELERQNQQ